MDLEQATTTIESPVDPDAPSSYLADEMKYEVESIDLLDIAPSERHRALYRLLCVRGRYEDGLERLKINCAAMITQAESKLRGFDWMFTQEMSNLTRILLSEKKAKSIKTPFGTVGFRTQPEAVVVEDEYQLMDAVANDKLPRSLVTEKTTRSISKIAVQEFFVHTGEVPVGCVIKPEMEKFYVK